MAKPRAKQSKATIVRGPDGGLFFIRDEVLEMCRMTQADVAQAERLLKGKDRDPATKKAQEESGFRIESAALEPLARVEAKIPPVGAKVATESTVMCCWSSLCFRRASGA